MPNRRLVSVAAVSTSATAYTGRADGLFSTNEQAKLKQAGNWPIAIASPSAPTIGTATAGNTQISVAFTAPSSLNGSTITGYTVTSSGGQTASGSSSPIIVTGLTNGTTYTFTVVANSASGSSIASSNVSLSPVAPLAIGDAMGGGFYAGKISTTADGVATHYLIVAPKASGDTANLAWGPYGYSGISSTAAGPSNSAALAAKGASYQAATFCEGLTIGGYSDWYLPTKSELEVLYYFLRPTAFNNVTNSGSNPLAVSPEPISTNYTISSPAQTSAGIGFRVGETQAFTSSRYWSSSEIGWGAVWSQDFSSGTQYDDAKISSTGMNVRAIRRLPII